MRDAPTTRARRARVRPDALVYFRIDELWYCVSAAKLPVHLEVSDVAEAQAFAEDGRRVHLGADGRLSAVLGVDLAPAERPIWERIRETHAESYELIAPDAPEAEVMATVRRLDGPEGSGDSDSSRRTRRRVFIGCGCLALLLALAALSAPWLFRRAESSMQRDFDAQRIAAQRGLVARIEAFRDQTGRCPLGHAVLDRRITVLLTRAEHVPSNDPRAPEELPPSALADDFAAAETSTRPLPVDPQQVAYDFFPAIQYETDGRAFVVGVSLYHEHPNAQQRGPHWYKLDLEGRCAPGSPTATALAGPASGLP